MLLEWKSKEICLTFDCCRGGWKLSRGKRSDGDAHARKVDDDSKLEPGWKTMNLSRGFETNGIGQKVSDLKKIFTLYATPNQYTSSDGNSLTKELFAVTKEGEDPIAITELAGTVNESWEDRDIVDQISEDHYVKGRGNWKKSFWPVEVDKVKENEKVEEMIQELEVQESEKQIANIPWLIVSGLIAFIFILRKRNY